MTNSFFQTRIHPDNVPLTAVNTPWGLYEWLVMPMGIKNAPSIHQHRVTAALWPFIRKICHVYLDDIVIWSQDVDEHICNIWTILKALEDAKLYCNPKKTKLFCKEIHFLGHWISNRGIEPDEGKADQIKNWPTPTLATDVRSFLGLVWYLSAFIPNLTKFTGILDELTKKECDKHFPGWKPYHQVAFDSIKKLVTSTACLTTIDQKSCLTTRFSWLLMPAAEVPVLYYPLDLPMNLLSQLLTTPNHLKEPSSTTWSMKRNS